MKRIPAKTGSAFKITRKDSQAWLGAILVGALSQVTVPIAMAQTQTNSTYGPMYFHSQVQDATECTMQVIDNKAMFPASIGSPAATCPDAFGWQQLTQAIQAQFWRNWANDETVWISEPKPLCDSSKATDCCFVSQQATGKQSVGYRDASGKVLPPKDVGAPGEFCPYIPGEWGGAGETTFAAGKPISSHNHVFLSTQDPGRVARQQEVEVVYRNDSFVRYTTAAELYSIAGLRKQFQRVSFEAANNAPYRPVGQGVAYPSDAVMFKADWIPERVMLNLGYLIDDGNPKTPPKSAGEPYVTMKMKVSTDGGKTYTEGRYYLIAITGASKALPNWHWYAFEHVDNLGRCDYTGCNDSFGYTTSVRIATPDPDSPQNPATHTIKVDKPCTGPSSCGKATEESVQTGVNFNSPFITPHTMDDGLGDGTDLFDTGKRYPSGRITTDLAAVFKQTGIGSSTAATDVDMPHPGDPAWKSYRLKGTQTQYYNRDGYPTNVGASVTEGGFVNTASCLSCHVQASVNSKGTVGVPAVGATGRLNLFGIGTVVQGAPYTGDYFDRGTNKVRAVQTDFVWGILFAQCPTADQDANGNCK